MLNMASPCCARNVSENTTEHQHSPRSTVIAQRTAVHVSISPPVCVAAATSLTINAATSVSLAIDTTMGFRY